MLEYIENFIRRRKGEILYTASNFVSPVVSMLTSFIAAAFIVPKDMGIIQSVLLLATYMNFLQLGIFNGLNRNIAFYKSRNDLDRMQDMVDTSFRVSKIISIIGLVIGVLSVFYYGILAFDGFQYVLASILLLITLVLTPLRIHLETTYRSGQEFGQLGTIILKENLVFTILSALPIFIGYLGKIISDSIKLIVGFILRLEYLPIKAIGKGSLKSFKELLAVGFPLMISGYLWTVFTVADQSYIVTKLGTEQLGLYTLARFCMTAMIMVPTAINSLLYPKASAIYGKTMNPTDLKIFWRKSIVLLSIVLIPIIILGFLLITPLTYYFLPKYIGGINAAKITLMSGITFISMGPSVIMGTLRKNILYIIAISCSIGLFWGICLLFPSYFSTIENIAKLRLFISSMISIFIIIYTYYLIHKNDD